MKKNIGILIMFFLTSCKDNAQVKNQKHNNFIINNLWTGDSIVSNLNFINKIDSSCKIKGTFFNRLKNEIEQDNVNCALSKIKFNYNRLQNISKNNLNVGKNSFIDLVIKKTIPKITHNADSYFEVTLFSIKNNQPIDSIVIYKSVNFSEALVADTRYFYITNGKIYLLDITEDETGSKVESWQSFKIDKSSGKISLLKSYRPINEKNEQYNTNAIDLSKWEGIYWLYPFEDTSEKKGSYFIDFFKDTKDFGLSAANGFNYKIKAQEIDNKLYLYDETEYSENISPKKSKAIITKNANKYYIESKLIKIERKDLRITRYGYLINWAKSIEDVPENP